MENPRLDSLLYSVLTTLNDGLGTYNNAITALAEKDAGWAKDIDKATQNLSDLFEKPNKESE